MTRHRSDERSRTAIWLLVACVSAIAGRGQAQTPRKACDFLTKSEAEVLLGTSVVDRSQGADCFFVETGWTNRPPKNRAIRFGLTESASPQPGAVVELRRNAEQYIPAGGGIRDVADFADAAYWLWIPGFGGTLTAFRGGTVTVSVNITGLPEEEALRKAKGLAAKPLGGSGPTGYAYQRPASAVRAAANSPASTGAATASPDATRRPSQASPAVMAKAANPRCAEASGGESVFNRFASTYSFVNGDLTLREFATLARADQIAFIVACAQRMAPAYPEGTAILATFDGPTAKGVESALDALALSLDTKKGPALDDSAAVADVRRVFIHYVLAARLTAPTDDAWVDSVVGSTEPVLLKGLFGGDFGAFAARRARAAGYLIGFNEGIAKNCSALYDSRVAGAARAQASGSTDEADTGQKAGHRDGEILTVFLPNGCQDRVLQTLVTSMQTYLGSPGQPSAAAASRPAPAGSKPGSPSTMTKAEAADTLDRLYGPTLIWHPDKEKPATVLKADLKFLRRKSPDAIFTEAVCAPNGASVNFQLVGEHGNPGPQYEWHEDPTASGEGIVDVRVTIDGAVHVAKGFLIIEGDEQYVNHMGVLFYEPGIAARVRGERRIETRTGTPLDTILGGLVGDAAQSEVDEGIRTSAGPLADLVNAHSIVMQIPIHDGNYQATLELNPRDRVLHDFAARCYQKF